MVVVHHSRGREGGENAQHFLLLVVGFSGLAAFFLQQLHSGPTFHIRVLCLYFLPEECVEILNDIYI